jgi:dTDP-4-amino-4,6-dideoxygalactose transaminase
MINYGRHYVDNNDLINIKKVFSSEHLTTGPFVKLFENTLKKYFDANYCLAVSSGSAALHMAGRALGWDKKTSVITTPITFVSTINSIIHNKSNPVLVDIDAKTYTIDPNLIEHKVKELRNRKIKKISIIAVDYAGHPCDWESLRYLSNKYGLHLVNDNCHSLGTKYKKKYSYAADYADIVTQSFHPVKNITTGEGGAFITKNKYFFEKVENFRSHCMEKNLSTKKIGRWYYNVSDLGFNYRINDIQCALGISQLKKIGKFLKRRNEIASLYNKSFSQSNFCETPKVKANLGIKHAYHLYPIQINFNAVKMNKKEFFNFFYKNKINLQVHYVPVYKFTCFKKLKFYKSKKFPVAENFYNNEVSLPIYYNLSNRNIFKVVQLVKRCLAN